MSRAQSLATSASGPNAATPSQRQDPDSVRLYCPPLLQTHLFRLPSECALLLLLLLVATYCLEPYMATALLFTWAYLYRTAAGEKLKHAERSHHRIW